MTTAHQVVDALRMKWQPGTSVPATQQPKQPRRDAAPRAPAAVPAAPVEQRPAPQTRRRAPEPHEWQQSRAADSLPANPDAEKSILGAIMLDNAAYSEVAAGLNLDDFSLDSHQRIFRTMGKLIDAGHAADITTLPDELLRKPKGLEAVGGAAYLAWLTDGLPRRPVIADYIRIVKECSAARKLLSMTEAIAARVSARDPVSEIKSWILEYLEGLRTDGANASLLWNSEGMDTFLCGPEPEIAWFVPNILARESLTQLYAPRGLGKTIIAHHWAVKLAAQGLRVLILDRDNSRRTVRRRLCGFEAEHLTTLRVISREKCPPLTQPEAWASFPYAEYDVVVVDSLDAMAEGVGEQDSAKPAKAMAPLLDICHREGGPAVLLLGNTIKSGEHSRGSGVNEDRADIVFEVRDGTGFRPSGTKPWIEELPAQGASEWAARSARRKGRSDFRVALVATKCRDGEEPAPLMLEARLGDIPYTVEDVTASVDAVGEAERLRVANEKQERYQLGLELLLKEMKRRSENSDKPILKEPAEQFLMGIETTPRITRKEARTIVASPRIAQVKGDGKGHPIELHGVSDVQQDVQPRVEL